MADTATTRARFCSQCGQPVTVAEAVFCKQCGAQLGAAGWLGEIASPAVIAVVLSVVTGLGHFYAGRTALAVQNFALAGRVESAGLRGAGGARRRAGC